MSIRTDFLRLAGLPVTESTIVEAGNPAFKDKETVALVRKALITTIHDLSDKATNATTSNLKQLYHSDTQAFDHLLGVLMSGKHAAAVKAWNKLDSNSRKCFYDHITDHTETAAVKSYFEPVAPEEEELAPEDDTPITGTDPDTAPDPEDNPEEHTDHTEHTEHTPIDEPPTDDTHIEPDADNVDHSEEDAHISTQGDDMQHARDLEDHDPASEEGIDQHEPDEDGEDDEDHFDLPTRNESFKLIQSLINEASETDPVHGKAPKRGTRAYTVWKAKVELDKKEDKEKAKKSKESKAKKSKHVKEAAGPIPAKKTYKDPTASKVKPEKQKVEANPIDPIDAIAKNSEKTEEKEYNTEKVKVPSDIISDITDAIKQLTDKINDKYVAHLPNVGRELSRYAEVIEILTAMKEVFKDGCPYGIKKISVLLCSLDGAMKPLIPGSVWKFLSIEAYNKTMLSSLKDLFKEIKIKNS